MNRSFFALGAATAALALTAGPAWAAPTATQSVNDSILAAQVGSVQVNAPVRVLSDGDNAAPGAAATGRSADHRRLRRYGAGHSRKGERARARAQ